MNLGTLALMGMLWGPGQAGDEYAINHRNIQIPIRFDAAQRGQIRELILFVSRNQGRTWEQEAVTTPDKEGFPFHAPSDGVYWFSVMVIDRSGRRDPPDVYAAPPGLKVLVDSSPPELRLKAADWEGDEVLAAWEVHDPYLDPDSFRLEYAAGASGWLPVPGARAASGHAKFRPTGSGPVRVRVRVADKARNEAEQVREVRGNPGNLAAGGPGAGAPALPPNRGGTGGEPPPPGPVNAAAMRVEAPPDFPPPPSVTALTAPDSPDPAPSAPHAPAPRHERPVPPGPEPAGGASPAPAAGGPAPLAVSNAQPGGPAGSPALPPPQILNALKFELGYEVQESGPSGVGRVELWLTRDDGQTWQRWGEDEDRQSPIAVDLDVRSNPQLEGVYGFKIVVQSGAGLSKGPPVSGDPPDMRVDIDITPPVVKIYNPLPDPSQRDTLVLRWETSDRNPAPEPITLEWSEMPEGPWHPIVSGAEPGAGDSPPAVGTSLNRPARRLPDTGTYAWRVPPNMPTHRVYLRVTARDAAGNVAEARTPQPIEIDLNKPVAKIQGIVGVPPAPRR